MKNYELINKLVKLPAGADVIFWGAVNNENIEDLEEGYKMVRQEIEETEQNNGDIIIN